MLVAISQRRVNTEKGPRDALESSYIDYLEKFGLTLVPIPNTSKNIRGYFDTLPIERIILSGGNDINPALYGQKAVYAKDLSVERDDTEKKLLEIAIERKIPVLGICRGMQFINVFFNGSLTQSIKEYKKEAEHVTSSHSIRILDIELGRLLDKKEIQVNSYHNQGITPDDLSKKLKAFAVCSDGIIEGIYHPSLPIAGIQWHPERGKMNNENGRIVKAFLGKKLFWEK